MYGLGVGISVCDQCTDGCMREGVETGVWAGCRDGCMGWV